MYKSIIIRSLVNGLAGALLYAVMRDLIRGVSPERTLMAPVAILLAVFVTVGSGIGFWIKAQRQ